MLRCGLHSIGNVSRASSPFTCLDGSGGDEIAATPDVLLQCLSSLLVLQRQGPVFALLLELHLSSPHPPGKPPDSSTAN